MPDIQHQSWKPLAAGNAWDCFNEELAVDLRPQTPWKKNPSLARLSFQGKGHEHPAGTGNISQYSQEKQGIKAGKQKQGPGCGCDNPREFPGGFCRLDLHYFMEKNHRIPGWIEVEGT